MDITVGTPIPAMEAAPGTARTQPALHGRSQRS